ncbi:MAG: hypothetical protein NXI25_25010 [bacterium]|nr:hypothetical protein [bacterium]
MDGFNVDLSGAIDLQNQDYTSPAGNQQGGRFLNWLGGNYLGLSEAARNVSCIFNPEACRPVMQPPQQPQATNSPGLMIWIVVAAVAVVILVVALRK